MQKKNVSWKVIVCAMICITILEIVALCNGINGVLLTTIVAMLAGGAGLVYPSPIKLK